MCAAIDMIASEHFFGRSPPAGFLTDYTPPIRRPHKLATRGFSAPCFEALIPVHLTFKPAQRSCIKTKETSNKRVIFADDKGYSLTQVRYMTEPSNVPPYWALKIADPEPKAEKTEAPKEAVDLWECRFVQPASDYLEFRRRITEDCVALENVIVKQDECAVDGTVKVKNLDFVKEVIVKASSDGWGTSEVTFCAFVESGPVGANNQSLYDTFGFRLQLPIHSRRMDFCVCFKSKGQEFWDNNKGKNYTIEKSSTRQTPAISCARIKYGNSWTNRTDMNGNTPYW